MATNKPGESTYAGTGDGDGAVVYNRVKLRCDVEGRCVALQV